MGRFVFFLAVGSAVGFGLASCGDKAVCTTASQCRSSETCLPSGLCARPCTTSQQCLTTEKCSTTGGCVATSGGCGHDADCPSGQVCLQGGTCSASSGGGGSGSTGGGQAGTGGSGAGGGGGGGAGAGAGGSSGAGGGGTCGEVFNATATEANIMIVLDKSGSMRDPVGGVSKWEAAKAAVTQLTNQAPAVRFGLTMFSTPSGCRVPVADGGVPIGPGTATQIQSALPRSADGSGTPIAKGIIAAAQDPGLADVGRSNGVVVITDGEENCGGDPVAEVQKLFQRTPSVRTWVVGFGGQADVDPDMLTQMAVKGGTARITTPRFYQADIQADLEEALQAISKSAQGCDFALAKAPDDPNKLFIAINNQLVPYDPTRVSGWYYDAATNRVSLWGPACDALANTAGASLTVQYGCSDGFDEGGDGGFDFEIG